MYVSSMLHAETCSFSINVLFQRYALHQASIMEGFKTHQKVYTLQGNQFRSFATLALSHTQVQQHACQLRCGLPH